MDPSDGCAAADHRNEGAAVRLRVAELQDHLRVVEHRYNRISDRLRRELPRFHDETCRELGNAMRVVAKLARRRLYHNISKLPAAHRQTGPPLLAKVHPYVA